MICPNFKKFYDIVVIEQMRSIPMQAQKVFKILVHHLIVYENSYIFKKPLPGFGIDTPVGEITEGLYRV